MECARCPILSAKLESSERRYTEARRALWSVMDSLDREVVRQANAKSEQAGLEYERKKLESEQHKTRT